MSCPPPSQSFFFSMLHHSSKYLSESIQTLFLDPLPYSSFITPSLPPTPPPDPLPLCALLSAGGRQLHLHHSVSLSSSSCYSSSVWVVLHDNPISTSLSLPILILFFSLFFNFPSIQLSFHRVCFLLFIGVCVKVVSVSVVSTVYILLHLFCIYHLFILHYIF